ncbi:MAG TPA: CDP-diacylglycerol--serine O-phosphatidyltransferase [Longimicrobiaceae bacterium]|nr:CDP-diacylglycerol--serine O-phosphatidyltransferase [Longimicrobiaceae bacterium]
MNGTRRRRLRRGVVILPSAFTLGSLFLGIWSIVAASRGNFETAGWFIVLASICDMIDGRVARFTATGTAFGEELDSLVDAVSFGVAPAMIMYFLYFSHEGPWSWVLSFIYIAGAICRLARFNIEQAGTAKTHFHGLPSPTAGITLASYYSFTQTTFFQTYFSRISVPRLAEWMMIVLAVLMVSSVIYPVVPRFSLRTWGGRGLMLLAAGVLLLALVWPEYVFFPAAVGYIAFGVLSTVMEGLQDRLPDRDPLSEEDEDEPDELRPHGYEDMRPKRHPAAGFANDHEGEELL